MGYRNINLVEEEFYHVYNRGSNKQIIFLDDYDRERFVKMLYLCNSTKSVNYRENIIRAKIDALDFDRGEQIVSIGAWVLMPNHFHLYLKALPKQGFSKNLNQLNSISEFMHKLLTSYSKYFNKKYKHSGVLFEGKFKAVHVNTDVQAKYLFSYIHLNPVKLIQKDWKINGIKDKNKTISFLNSYKWGSYQDYVGINRKEKIILDKEKFPDYFKDKNSFLDEIFDWLSFKESIF